jgi:hypothetical protein
MSGRGHPDDRGTGHEVVEVDVEGERGRPSPRTCRTPVSGATGARADDWTSSSSRFKPLPTWASRQRAAEARRLAKFLDCELSA